MAVIVKKTFLSDKKTWELYILKLCRHRFMCEAYPIAKLLGNKRPELAIRNCVDQSKTWSELITYFNCGSKCIFQLILPPVTPAHWQSNTLFINEAGVISLINSSTLPVANKFKWWFFRQIHDEAYMASPDPFLLTTHEEALVPPLNLNMIWYEQEIDIKTQQQIKRDKSIAAKQHQQQRKQQRQQRPMVMRDERQRPTRKGTRGCASLKQ